MEHLTHKPANKDRGIRHPSQLLKQYVSIVPVINNGTHRWAIDYGIQGRGGGVGMTSARKYNSLGDPALVYAVKQIVVKHSVGSFEETEEELKRQIRESLKEK